MSDEPIRYTPTDQDLRNNALYIAERLVTVKIQNGGSNSVPDPVTLAIEYAKTIFNYVKGETK